MSLKLLRGQVESVNRDFTVNDEQHSLEAGVRCVDMVGQAELSEFATDTTASGRARLLFDILKNRIDSLAIDGEQVDIDTLRENGVDMADSFTSAAMVALVEAVLSVAFVGDDEAKS